MNEQREAIEQHFHVARELQGEQRAAFLDRVCGSTPEMRRRIERLLHEDAGASFLDTPAVELVPVALPQGARLGPYEIVSLAGIGGMGHVYRAHDTRLKRDVAIKGLPAGISLEPRDAGRFEREAMLLASLNHPNIAAIYDIVEGVDCHYLILEFVEGPTLAERLRQGQIPVDETLQITRQIALALEAAHAKGIVHRDLKPANIKVTSERAVKVLDFGLAKALAGNQPDTTFSKLPSGDHFAGESSLIMGTPAYTSPEQAAGNRVDGRSDIWSLGCVIYEMLTGQRAFDGAKALMSQPDWNLLSKCVVADGQSESHRDLQRVVAKCLEAEPARRYRSARELLNDLQSIPVGTHRLRFALLTVFVTVGLWFGATFLLRSQEPPGPDVDDSVQLAPAETTPVENVLAAPAGDSSITALPEDPQRRGLPLQTPVAKLPPPPDAAPDELVQQPYDGRKSNRVRMVTPDGTVVTLAGYTTRSLGAVASDAAGILYVADASNNRIRKVTRDGAVSTAAGNGMRGFDGDGGAATVAMLADPMSVAVDAAGNLYIADTGNVRIRKVTRAGAISTVAGSGIRPFNGDSFLDATRAMFRDPLGIAVDASGNLYIADTGNHRVCKVTPDGVVRTIAGETDNPSREGGRGVMPGFSGDGGSAAASRLSGPEGVAVDAAGNVYIADTRNNRVRKVTLDGVIRTVAGTGVPGFSGDGRAAVSARLAGPGGVAVDPSGNLYIADTWNHRIRKVTADGVIHTVAGSSAQSYNTDGAPAKPIDLFLPASVSVDAAGNLYFTDTFMFTEFVQR